MTQYPIRCCCQPQKIFGYLDLPDGLRDGDRLPIQRPLHFSFNISDRQQPLPTPETILIKTFSEWSPDHTKMVKQLAVYSEDRPLEFWQELRGFTPA